MTITDRVEIIGNPIFGDFFVTVAAANWKLFKIEKTSEGIGGSDIMETFSIGSIPDDVIDIELWRSDVYWRVCP